MDLHVAVASGRPEATRVAERLTRIVQDELPRACADALGSLGDGDAVIRIERLHLELLADADATPGGALAERWGRELAAAVRDAIASSRGVVRFDSPLDYVAAFLRDLIDGRAWGRWCWDELRPLASLAPGAAAAALLSARPGWIADVLRRLESGGGSERLIARLGEADVRQLWTALGLPAAPALAAPASPAWGALERLWPRLRLDGGESSGARARDALRAWLALARERAELRADPDAAALLLALVELAALIRSEPRAGALLAAGRPLERPLLERVAAGAHADVLAWVVPAAGDARLARAAELAGAAKPARDAATRSRTPASPVGAVLLIAPALAELGVWELWLDELGEDAARRNLYATALKALGRERAPLALGDEALAALAGLARPPPADARVPMESEPSLAWREALLARSEPADPVLAHAPGISVLRDWQRGRWVAAWPEGTGPPAAVAAGRPALREADEAELGLVAAEAGHLQLGRRLGLPWLTPGLDAALSAATSMALRATAGRIPGFGSSSPAYLAARFLAQPATVRWEGGELVAELDGGPLAAVLRMADLPESQPLPWAGAAMRLHVHGGVR